MKTEHVDGGLYLHFFGKTLFPTRSTLSISKCRYGEKEHLEQIEQL